MSSTLITIAFIFLLSFLIMLNFVRFLKKASLEKALVIYGKVDPKNEKEFLVITKGITMVWPIIQEHYYFWMDTYRVESERKYQDQNGKEINVDIKIEAKPNDEKKHLEIAVKEFFGKNKEQIETEIRSKE